MRQTQKTPPPFIADPRSIDRNSGRQIDWDSVPDSYRKSAITVTVATTALAGAITLEVEGLPGEIPLYTALYFGPGKFARLAAAALGGATAITVEALGAQIDQGDTAIYPGTKPKVLPAGTAMCEMASGKIIPRAARPGAEPCMGFLEVEAVEGDITVPLTGYPVIIGGALWENWLPEAIEAGTGVLPDEYKTELVNAANPRATGFAFLQARKEAGWSWWSGGWPGEG